VAERAIFFFYLLSLSMPGASVYDPLVVGVLSVSFSPKDAPGVA